MIPAAPEPQDPGRNGDGFERQEYALCGNIVQSSLTRLGQAFTITAALYTAIIFIVVTILSRDYGDAPRIAAPYIGALGIGFWNLGMLQFVGFETFTQLSVIRRMNQLESAHGLYLMRQTFSLFKRSWNSPDPGIEWTTLTREEQAEVEEFHSELKVPGTPARAATVFLVVVFVVAIAASGASTGLILTDNLRSGSASSTSSGETLPTP